MTKDTALRMAIEVMDLYDYTGSAEESALYNKAIQACKEVLAETQEPVSYHPTSQEQSVMHQAMIRSSKLVHKATPPSREWQSLSDEEMSEIFASIGWVEKDNNLKDLGFYDHARAIEAKVREKNG